MAVDEDLWNQCQQAARHPVQGVPQMLGLIDGNRAILADFNEIKLKPDRPHELPHHMDTVEGANDLEAPWCKREWGERTLLIDSNLSKVCWPFVLYHEAIERRHMAKGMTYDKAHEIANQHERQLRLRARAVRPTAPQTTQNGSLVRG